MTFQIQDAQHKEWFIVGLIPHIQILLTYKRMVTYVEVFKIVMCLEPTLGGAETSVGLAQVQSQLANLTIQL
jgi:hypothetical protein